MKVKGREPIFGLISHTADRSRALLRGRQIGSCGVGFGWVMGDRRKFGCFGARAGAVGGCRRLAVDLLGCRLRGGRESMTCRSADVLGLVVCRATLPFEGLLCAPRCHARARSPSWRSCLPV